jgi:hypothetical protein
MPDRELVHLRGESLLLDGVSSFLPPMVIEVLAMTSAA